MKKFILILTCLLSLFSRAAVAVDPVSLPFTYSGITFNHAFTFVNSGVTHVCYFKNPTFFSMYAYPTPYYPVESDAMYTPDGSSCGGTYLAHNARLIPFVTNPPYCAGCGIVMSCPLNQNTWSSFDMSIPSWWPTSGTNICGTTYYPNDNLYPTNNPSAQLTVNLSPSAGGDVTSSPSGISCGTSCQADFDLNESVQLTAYPSTGWVFRGKSAYRQSSYIHDE